MMIKAQKLTKGILSLVSRAFRNVAMYAALPLIFAGAGLAATDNFGLFFFANNQNAIYNLSYEIARDTMKETLERKNEEPNPVIAIAEEDLNGDKFPEIITRYLPDDIITPLVCDKKGNCPFYVLEVDGKTVRTLAVILNARTMGRGIDVHNGYWDLRAYPDRSNLKNFTTYTYDKTKKLYVTSGSAPAKPK